MLSGDVHKEFPSDIKQRKKFNSYTYDLVNCDLTPNEKLITEKVNSVCETSEDIEQTKMDSCRDIGLDEDAGLELTMSLEGHVNPSDTINGNLANNFQDTKPSEFCCDCHCTRNFQQKDKTSIKSNSGNLDRDCSKHQLSHEHSFNVENDIKVLTFRTRLKLSRKLLSSTDLVSGSVKNDDTELQRNSNLSNDRSNCFNKNMALIFGCSATIVIILCLCGVVFMMNQSMEHTTSMNNNSSSYSKLHHVVVNSSKQHIETTTEPRIIMDLPYRSVRLEEFEEHLEKSKSAAEAFKVFFSDKSLTEEQVNSIMHMKRYYVHVDDNKDNDEHLDDYSDVDIDTVQASDAFIDDSDAMGLAFQHHTEMTSHPFSSCQDPQPELVRVDLQFDNPVQYFYPKCTILHRCRNTTGCCANGAVCAPRSKDGIELVYKYFMVVEQVPGVDGIQPAPHHAVFKTFINHTACECKPLVINTNCKKDCPIGFVKRRGDDENCKCMCKHGQRHCKQISRGLLPLEEEGLACIKRDECIVPDCQSGKFDINTGYCPAFRRHGHNRRGGKHRKRRG
ncbi:hypothetical protein ACF0H5_010495 [Mactra antiquata]